MKRNRFISLQFIIAIASMLAILATVASFTPQMAAASERVWGGTEACTIQICPDLPADAFPITIKITYEDGSTRTIIYNGPTVEACPDGEFEGGHVVPGLPDAGKVVSIEVMGTIAIRDGGPVEVTINEVEVTIAITIYNGHTYFRIRVDF